MPNHGVLSSLWNRLKLYKSQASESLRRAGVCLVCGGFEVERGAMCQACWADLPRRTDQRLKRNILSVDTAFAAFHYEFPITELIKSVKFWADLGALSALKESFAAALAGRVEAIDFLVPVPLAPLRFARRGFNQAGELARALGSASKTPVRFAAIEHTHAWAAAQSRLGARARLENSRGAFRAAKDLSGARICIVDDVITTGATCSAVAAALRAAGASEVIAVAVAATALRQRSAPSGIEIGDRERVALDEFAPRFDLVTHQG